MPDLEKTNDVASARRVLIVTDAARAVFQVQLAAAAYETLATTSAMALQAIEEFFPQVLLVEVGGDDLSANARVALAHQIHGRAATYALPIIFVCDECGASLRDAALKAGVDDYFARSTPFPEVLARLDALFWRVEVGRRAPGTMGNHRLEIDNFLLLLESVREHVAAGLPGSIAILRDAGSTAAASPKGSKRERLLNEALGFFKLHLRRLDSVAFYGPDALIAYLPDLNSGMAGATLRKLRDQFAQLHSGTGMTLGLASFPAEGTHVEQLLQRCEAAAIAATQSESVTSEHLEFLVSRSESAKTSATNASELSVSGESHLEPPSSLEGAAPPSDVSGPGRILLAVSDAPRMARLNSLVRSAGYDVRAAFDGEQALNLLRIERPDLLMLESELSKIDGLEMMRRLRKQGNGKLLLPVLFLNSSGDQSAGEEARILGARKVLTQPYDPADVLAGVREVSNTH